MKGLQLLHNTNCFVLSVQDGLQAVAPWGGGPVCFKTKLWAGKAASPEKYMFTPKCSLAKGQHVLNQWLSCQHMHLLRSLSAVHQASLKLHAPMEGNPTMLCRLPKPTIHGLLCSTHQVLGYLAFTLNSMRVHIQMLAVSPSHRRQGVASALLRVLFKHALAQKLQWGSLCVATSNTAALGLYHKAGFCKDGTVQDYYGPGMHQSCCCSLLPISSMSATAYRTCWVHLVV